MKRKVRHLLFMFTPSLLLGLLATDVVAQDAAESAPATGGLEEIMVTARRREEDLMTTPVSITAFTSDEIEARQFDSVAQLREAVPNLQYRTGIEGLNGTALVFIRGIGQGDFVPSLQAGVGTYLDGVYIASSSGAVLDTVDVGSIEVLRGPQGTLFGRNTIGGALVFTSKKPTEEFEGDVQVQVGERDRLYGRVTVNGAITDNLFGRVALMTREEDGYVKTPNGPDEGLGNDDTDAFRGALRWLASEDVTVDFAADYTKTRQNGPPQVLFDVNTETPGGNVNLWNNVVAPTIGDGPYDDRYVGSTGSDGYVNYSDFENPYTGLRTDQTEAEVWGLNLTVDWDLGPVSLKSITAYREQEHYSGIDGDMSPEDLTWRTDILDGDQFTQEFQFSGEAFDERLNYVVGAYYFEESMVNINDVQFPAFLIVSGSIVDNQNYALYGQATYDITENWSFTGGYRYSWDRFDSIIDDRIQYIVRLFAPGAPGNYAYFPAPPAPGAFYLTSQGVFPSDFDGGDPYLNLAYSRDNWMVYASYSEGYKSGGFNQRLQPGAQKVTFGPEEAAVYELGFKMEGFDSRMRLTGALFHTDYDELQVSVSFPGGVGNSIVNAGKADIDGGELELQAAVTPNLVFSAGVGYLDGEYTELAPGVTFPITNVMPNIPEWTGNASGTLTLPFDSGAALVSRLDYSYVSDFYNTADNDFLVESYWLMNANITYISPSEKWEVGVMARNLTDEYYWDRGRSAITTDRAGYYSLGAPRTVVFNFRYRF